MKMSTWLSRASVGALILASSSAFAVGLCQTRWSDFQTKLNDSSNRLAFTNQPGPMNIGMCWWHSRMQRNANYLLDFQSRAAQPTTDQAWQIIKNLSHTDAVQAVGGYPDLSTFYATLSAEMNESIGQWQMSDSFLKFGWANGLASSEVDAGAFPLSKRTTYLLIFLGLTALSLALLKTRKQNTEQAAEVSSAAAPAVSAAAVENPKSVPAIPKDEAPQAVLDWSTDLGRGMLDAFKDSAKADKMFLVLGNCAEDKSVGLTYRAVCAGNAKRLSDRFPEKYGQNFNGREHGLPERIQKFLAEANTNF
jgi:hypothetical protein